MYKVPYFSDGNEADIHAFIREHNFVILSGAGAEGSVATQVPVLVSGEDGELVLEGHIMKNTDHHKAFAQDPRTLVIFTGPHRYVSASWYKDPRVASTWNYMTVQARGVMELLDEQDSRNLLEKLTDFYEPSQSPASFKELSQEYVDRMVKAIIGFRIRVESLEHVFKLSQNRDTASRNNIIEQLRSQDNQDARKIADEMEKRLKDV